MEGSRDKSNQPSVSEVSVSKVPPEYISKPSRLTRIRARGKKLILSSIPSKFREPPPVPATRQLSKEHATKNPLSLFTFAWAGRTVWTSSVRQLQINDIPQVHPKRKVNIKGPALKKYLNKYTSERKSYPLLRSILKCYWKDLFWTSLCELLCISIGRNSPEQPSFAHGFGLVFTAAAIFCIAGIFHTHAVNSSAILGGQVRTLLSAAMFEKSLKISSLANKPVEKSLSTNSNGIFGTVKKYFIPPSDDDEINTSETSVTWTEGETINLINSDTERVELAIANFIFIWPVVAALPQCLGLAWWLGGWAGVVGIFVSTLCVPALFLGLTKYKNIRRTNNKVTDARITLVNDLVNGIRLLRAFAWEDIYIDKLLPIRAEELRLNKLAAFWSGVMEIIGSVVIRLTVPLTVALYSLHNDVNNQAIVMPLSIVVENIMIITFSLPKAVVYLINAAMSMQRIEDYLVAQERKEGLALSTILSNDHMDGIVMQDAKFTWVAPTDEKDKKAIHGKFELAELNLSIGRNELVAIIGPVGCGKSSILAAMVGDMEPVSGQMSFLSIPAYCPQSVWIQSASVRENILFGKSFDEEYYHKVLAACSLYKDFELFPHADDTMLGEKGINLSGGQKQRIHLARTLYQQSEVILLDDPLSAVDVHTGEHIFEEAINGLYKNKCRVLATHQLQVLARCDNILYMEHGKIIASGTYDELRTNSVEFLSFIGTCQQKEFEENAVLDTSNKRAIDQSGKPIADEIMIEEERSNHSVPFKAYLDYLKAAHNNLRFFLTITCSIPLSQVANVSISLVIAWWTSRTFHLSTATYIGLSLLMIFSHQVLWLQNWTECRVTFVRSSGTVTERALRSTLHAPLSFFDTTPVGRILNRFTLDITVTDSILPGHIWEMLLCLVAVISIAGLTIAYVPLVATTILPWIIITSLLSWYYRSTPLELKRLEALRSSFVVAKLSEGISGQSSIRSTRRIGDFVTKLSESIDELNSIHFLSFSCTAWVNIRTAFTAFLFNLVVALLILNLRFKITPAVSVLIFSHCDDLSYYLQAILYALSELQKGMNAVERLVYYANSLPQEAARRVVGFNKDDSWPSTGSIDIKNVVMGYRPELKPALTNLNVHIDAGSKVAIVGRTGAGKSSIIAALLRLTELREGIIEIDGVDIAKIGLYDLRNKIAVIPQDPTLFAGTIRSNLDPEGIIDDLTLNMALRNAALGSNTSDEKVDEIEKQGRSLLTLDSTVDPSGRNLSHGERQLMALARALVRDSKIILSDEATSSVDLDTDAKIQHTLKYGFKDKTVITIAHRLATVLHYDKVIVMDKGAVLEYDTPLNLFRNTKSTFRSMCNSAMITEHMIGNVVEK